VTLYKRHLNSTYFGQCLGGAGLARLACSVVFGDGFYAGILKGSAVQSG